jgi:aminopeptidase-like protein
MEDDRSTLKNSGQEMHTLMRELFPICRSITGNGVRTTMKILQRHIPLQIHEVPSGTQVFDWEVPQEWNITDAYIKDAEGRKVVDFQENNLHILNYSIQIHKTLSLAELRPHLHSLPEYPDWIPYLTTYYKRDWGFCLTHNQLENLKDGLYEVVIDSNLTVGSLTYGELFIEGKSSDEVLLTCYTCHPSMCNDNLSGVTLVTQLAKWLLQRDNKYSYRLLFIPETIGAITWLSRNEHLTKNIKHGLVVTCVGGPDIFSYKKSRDGNNVIDKVVPKALQDLHKKFNTIDFFPSGSDERQFCSPGFNLPVGSLIKSVYGQFPQYHTSADNLEFVRPENLQESYAAYKKVIEIVEGDATYLNLNQKCEPQLGKRGLYTLLGAQKNAETSQLAIMWVLNMSDGKNSLLDISCHSDIQFSHIKAAADLLLEHGLLRKI